MHEIQTVSSGETKKFLDATLSTMVYSKISSTNDFGHVEIFDTPKGRSTFDFRIFNGIWPLRSEPVNGLLPKVPPISLNFLPQ